MCPIVKSIANPEAVQSLIARLDSLANRPQQAKEAWEAALRFYDRLAKTFAGVPRDQRQMANRYRALADYLAHMGRHDWAEETYQHALKLDPTLATSKP